VIGGNVNTNTLTGTGVTIGSSGNINLSATGNIVLSTQTYINNLSSPVQNNDAATKQYVDDIAQGLHTHDSCNAATPTTLATISSGTVTYDNGTSGVGATLTTTGTYTTIDGVTLSNGMRILVKNEVDSARNGIYDRTSATVLTRSTDFDTPTEMAGGDFTFVTAGTVYDNTGWVMTEPVTTVGTSPVPWVQFSGAGTYTAGTGLTLTGSEFSVNASQTQVTSVGTLGSLAVTANITGGNILTGGLISATGNVTADYLFGNGSQLTGIAASYGNANVVANLAALGSNPVSTTGNVTGGNVNAAGLSLSSNVVSALNSTANITTTANIAGNYFIGNGSQLTGIAGGANYSNANVATFLADFGSNVISTTGNVTAGNLDAVNLVINSISSDDSTFITIEDGVNVNGEINATGNITGGNVISGGVRVYKWTTQANTAPSNSVPGDNWYDSYADKLYLYINDGVGNQWVDQSSPTTFASLNILGNTASGNLSTLGQVSAAGNVTGNYIFGNGSQLTGIDATSIQNGTSNVRVVSSGGNITVGVGGTANVVQFANTGAFVTGVVSVSGNVTGGNLIISGSISDSAQLDINTTAANANIVLTPNGTGNVNTPANVSVTGNVQGGNLRTTGVISATGNGVISGRDFMIGGTFNSYSTAGRTTLVMNGGASGALLEMALSNTSSGYLYQTTTDMYLINLRSGSLILQTAGGAGSWTITSTSILSGAGNVQGGNLRTTGLISATGNITGGNVNTGNLSLTGNVISPLNVTGNITSGNLITGAGSGGNITGANVISANTVTATANVTGGNLLTGGLISATGNITGSNLIISGSISDSAQLDINTTSANANIVLTPNGTGNVNTGANVSVTGNITGGNILGVPVATNGIVVNSLTVATSYTIATGYSGTSAGPITISGGVVVTVSPGSRWVVI
jgi:hypothetical protein